MPKFAANLSMMFNEHPFPQRFAAAAQAGFSAVEFLFPYEYAPADVAGWLRENRLANVLFNLPPGIGRRGSAASTALPGREAEFREGVARALEYALALGTPRVHAMAGILPAGADRARHRATFVENLRLRRARVRSPRPRRADRADQHARHAGLLPRHAGRGARDSRGGRRAEPRGADGPLPPPGRRGRRRDADTAPPRPRRAISRWPACPTATNQTRAS